MKTKPIWTIFLTLAAGGLAIIAMIAILRYLTKPSPVLTGYLSTHEMHLPSDSALQPEFLKARLSREALERWVGNRERQQEVIDLVIADVDDYISTHILSDIENDPFFRYSHYYRMIIENEGEEPFRKVYVKFPHVAAAEVRRSTLENEAEPLVSMEGRFGVGDINPGESVTIFGWNDRPFYVQEEQDVVLGHQGGLSEILYFKMEKPVESWVKQNIVLLVIFISLILLLLHKMVLTINTCVRQLDPDLEERSRC
ncbi:MAG: hypothetical protein JXR72_02615 [Proteobacteria bacterium]|nr:hypothetical protein [Pseudomonadota bacterium]